LNEYGAHLGDDAELYPLGALDDGAARRVERHIAGCAPCAARVADAQFTAASLGSALPAAAPPAALAQRLRNSLGVPAAARAARWDLRALALAAALALALAGLAWQSVSLRAQRASQAAAFATIVHSHFRHVTMEVRAPAPFGAKVLYAPDGSWIYVIADRPPAALRAFARTAGGEIDLGPLERDGSVQTLLARPPARISTIDLRDGAATVASATLAY
jgi:hypothetical protein